MLFDQSAIGAREKLPFLFGCGGGIFHCPPPNHSRLSSVAGSLLMLLDLAVSAVPTHSLRRLRLPVVVKWGKARSATNAKRHPIGCLCVVLYRLNRCHGEKVNKIKGF